MSMFTDPFAIEARRCLWNDPRFFDGVQTAQWPWEIESAKNMLSTIKATIGLEIGCMDGGTARFWLRAMGPGGVVYGVDPVANRVDLPGFVPLVGVSQDRAIFETVKALAPFDFLFIDGDHSYDIARFDFMTFGPLVRQGGLIMLHDIDTYREDCGVPQLWREIQRAGYLTRELQAVHDPDLGGPGGGIGLVIVEVA